MHAFLQCSNNFTLSQEYSNLDTTMVYVEMTRYTKRRQRQYHVDGEDVQTTARQRERRWNRKRERERI